MHQRETYVNGMYVPRQGGGRGMINLEMCLKT